MSSSQSVPPPKNVARDWLSVEEAGEYLGISRTKFDELKDRGVLKGTYIQDGRLIRFNRKLLNKALRKRLGGR